MLTRRRGALREGCQVGPSTLEVASDKGSDKFGNGGIKAHTSPVKRALGGYRGELASEAGEVDGMGHGASLPPVLAPAGVDGIPQSRGELPTDELEREPCGQ